MRQTLTVTRDVKTILNFGKGAYVAKRGNEEESEREKRVKEDMEKRVIKMGASIASSSREDAHALDVRTLRVVVWTQCPSLQ